MPTASDSASVEGGNTGNRFSYAYGITVDVNGDRFIDEGADFRSNTLQSMGNAILRCPHATAFQLFDQQGAGLLQVERYRESRPAVADTIDELARSIGVDPDRLRRTVDRFNGSVDAATPFDPARVDGSARVLRVDGRPIPELFASGDIVGLFHGGDPSGSGQTRTSCSAASRARGQHGHPDEAR